MWQIPHTAFINVYIKSLRQKAVCEIYHMYPPWVNKIKSMNKTGLFWYRIHPENEDRANGLLYHLIRKLPMCP